MSGSVVLDSVVKVIGLTSWGGEQDRFGYYHEIGISPLPFMTHTYEVCGMGGQLLNSQESQAVGRECK